MDDMDEDEDADEEDEEDAIRTAEVAYRKVHCIHINCDQVYITLLSPCFEIVYSALLIHSEFKTRMFYSVQSIIKYQVSYITVDYSFTHVAIS